MGSGPSRPFQAFSPETSNYIGVTILSKNGYEIVGADAQSDAVRAIYTSLSQLTEKPEKHVIVTHDVENNLIRIACKKIFSDSMFSSERSAIMQKLAWSLILLNLRKAGWEHALSSDLQTGATVKYADLQFFRKTDQPAPTDMICVAPSAADSIHIVTPVSSGPEIERCVIDSVRKYWKGLAAPVMTYKDTSDKELAARGWQLTELKFPGGIWMTDSASKSFWSGNTDNAEKFANARYLLSDIVTNCGKDSGWRLYTTANIKSTTDWLFFCKFSENVGGNFSSIGTEFGASVFEASAPPPPAYIDMSSVLPDQWEEMFSEEHKAPYYVNHQTQQTQWFRPEASATASYAPPNYTSSTNHFYNPFADTAGKTPPKTVSLVDNNKIRVLGFDPSLLGHFRGAIQQSGLGIEKEDNERYDGLDANAMHFKLHGFPWGREANDNSRLAVLNMFSSLASQGLELVTEIDTSRNHRDKSTFVIAPNHVQNNADRRFLAISTEDTDKLKLIGSFSPEEVSALQRMLGASYFPVMGQQQSGMSYVFHLHHGKGMTQVGIWHCQTWISHKSGFMINLLGVMEAQLGWKLMCKMDISTWVHAKSTGSGKNRKTTHYLKGSDTWIFSK